MTVKSYRVGIVGSGYIADWHLKGLKSISAVEVVAICDLSLSRANKLAVTVGAQAYTDYSKMLEEANLDAVQILTPPHIHYSQAKLALEAGLHVFMEKPMCTIPEQCQELDDLAKAKGLCLGVGHNFLFYPIYEELRNDLKSGKIGLIQEVSISWHQELPQHRFGPFDTWMLAQPSNIMLEIGAHLISQVIDLLGMPEEVVSVYPDRELTLPGNRRFYRRWLVNAICKQARVALSFDFQSGYPEYTVNIRGSLGSATVDFLSNTYHLKRDTTYSMDINRYKVTKSEAKSLKKYGIRNLRNYILGKAKLSNKDNFYGYSITRALQSFYSILEAPESLDTRLSGNIGRDIIDLGCRIGGWSTVEANDQKVIDEGSLPINSKPATILLLGGTGFIGQELLFQLLEKGHQVRVLTRSLSAIPFSIDHPGLSIMEGSIFSESDMDIAMKGIETVYHLAVARANMWAEWLATDIYATELIANKCLEHSIKRLIYTGTIDSYWSGNPNVIITEKTGLDTEIEKRNFYARAKARSEDILNDLHKTRGLPVVIVRPGVVIGNEGSPIHWGVGMWNGLGVVQVWGQGKSKLPLVLVQDVADGMVRCLDKEGIEGESFNLIGPPLLTARDYLAAIEEKMNLQLQIHFVSAGKFYIADFFKWLVKVAVRHPNKERVPSYRDFASRSHQSFYDCSKAKDVLGWSPENDRGMLLSKGVYDPCAKLME